MQELRKLIDIAEYAKYKTMSYDHSLEEVLITYAKTNNIPFLTKTNVPISDDITNAAELNQCFENQWMKIPLLDNFAIVTCNPFNSAIPPYIDQKKTYLTSPKTFIYFLAHQQNNAPTIGIFELIHYFANAHKVTDIHIEPKRDSMTIVFRQTKQYILDISIDLSLGDQLINYIKLKSHVDISIKHKPQEGHYHYSYNEQLFDIRSSTLPIHNGEALSLRLFSPNKPFLTFKSLGFCNRKIDCLNKMISKPNGLILITGATGSGKSTTLYTMLRALQRKKKHITTLEDPIEQVIPNIWQTNIDSCISFEHGFKSLLRHAPDVIGIGEIRDKQTASLVLNAAFSGHLVIASMHTNGVKSTLLRLHSLGCDSFLVSYCLRGIISQTLTPKNKQRLELKSEVFVINSEHYIMNLKHELTEYINNNTLVI